MENQLQVVEVQGVHGFIDEKGVAWLNVENVARGLGFVMVRKERVTTSGDSVTTSGDDQEEENYYTSVRWNRVNGYLAEYDYPPVKAGDFIPENIFYLLAMKANNETAKKFQLKVANEILPSIRRTGSYSLVGKENELLTTFAKFVDLEREKFIAANTEEAKTMAKVQLLRELASASKDDFIRNELVLNAARLLLGEDFGVKKVVRMSERRQ